MWTVPQPDGKYFSFFALSTSGTIVHNPVCPLLNKGVHHHLSLAIRITRICTEPHTREQRYSELFIVSWDPRLPSFSAITNRHWRSMTSQDKLMKETLPEPPLIAYKRPRNIGDSLIRAKVNPINVRPKRKLRA